jgi:hypothetical protein
VMIEPVILEVWDRGPSPFSVLYPPLGTPRRVWEEQDGLGSSVSANIVTETPRFPVFPNVILTSVPLTGWDRGPNPFSTSHPTVGTLRRVWEEQDGLGPSVSVW